MTWIPFVTFGGGGGGGGSTTINYYSTVNITQASHGLVSGDAGKPIGWQESGSVGVWDDAADPQTEYPAGILKSVTSVNAFVFAPPGVVLDIPAALITVAGTEPVGAGSEPNSRFLYWDSSADEYVTEPPGDEEVTVECIYYMKKNGDGSHKVLVLGYRASGVSGDSVSTQTGTPYTFVMTDGNTLVQYSSGSAGTFEIPENADAPFAIGTTIAVAQAGAGQLTIAGAGSVTLLSESSRDKTSGQHAMASLIKVATDTWRLEGNLVA